MLIYPLLNYPDFILCFQLTVGYLIFFRFRGHVTIAKSSLKATYGTVKVCYGIVYQERVAGSGSGPWNHNRAREEHH